MPNLRRVNERIVLANYDPLWPQLFLTEAHGLKAILGERALAVEHVGSTAVPGLQAKPVIDIVLVVADSADEPAYTPALENAGYVLRTREPHWFEHRLFKGPRANINLHVFSSGCPEITRMLAFRDRLRTSDADRERYASVKRTLAEQTWKKTQDYADAKTDVIAEIMTRA
jgi:GrpB-like predicted nucleotidyltransferase (UPF0157 family)